MQDEEGVLSLPDSKVVWNAQGEIIKGGHTISEEDFVFLGGEVYEQFSVLTGRIMQLLEAAGLPEKQEKAIKRYMKSQIWERHGDLMESMRSMSRIKYKCDGFRGIPIDEYSD